MSIELKDSLLEKITYVYGEEKANYIYHQIRELINRYCSEIHEREKNWVDEKDVMLITYGDSIKEDGKDPLKSLREFLNKYVKGFINAVHILPFYPYSSDDGFSVIDYLKVNEELGNWDDILDLSGDFDLMFDAVINHISKESDWFQEFLKGNPKYRDYFIVADPDEDYSKVVRPRALPLLTKFTTKDGEKYVWTTFSDDQIDLNYKSEKVLIDVIEILLNYIKNGARFIRLDAIGFLWKELGTSCIHLPETHKIIQIIREIVEEVAPGTILISETNVPHKENISYFGNGYNEAHLVYQFPLPPLTLFSILTGSAKYLLDWANSLEPTTEKTAFFNFLASHDGIGVRPVEGILTDEEVEFLVKTVQNHGGFVSYKDNGDGTKSPYELNINYFDALSHPNDPKRTKVDRFIAAHSILLSMAGVPGIYIHSLLGSQNYLQGVRETGIYRTINREKLNRNEVEEQLEDRDSIRYHVFNKLSELIKIRIQEASFHPNASQKVLFLDERTFSLQRISNNESEMIISLTNVSKDKVSLTLDCHQLGISEEKVVDLVTDETFKAGENKINIELKPYQIMWLKSAH